MPTLKEALNAMPRREVSSAPIDIYEDIEIKKYPYIKILPLVPILCFESMVIILGTSFFHEHLGFKFSHSVTTSFCVEFFYMYFSAKRGWTACFLRHCFFILSVSCLTFALYSTDPLVLKAKQLEEKSIQSLNFKKINIEKRILRLEKEEDDLKKDMDIYRSYKLISKGRGVLEKEKIRIAQERKFLWEKLNSLKVKKTKKEFLETWNILNLSLKTKIAIFAISLIQIGICFSLPEILRKILNKGGNS